MKTADIVNSRKRPLMSGAYSAAVGLLTIFFMPVLLCTVGWCFGVGCASWYFPASLVIGLALTYGLSRSAKTVIYMLLFIAIAIAGCAVFFDPTYDSNAYHKAIMLMLIEGWNPLDITTYSADENIIWIFHYAKIMEISAASLSTFIGTLEAGKAMNLLLLASVATAGYDFLARKGLSVKKNLAVLFVGFANPVLCSQILTGHNDFTTYLCTTFSLILICDMIEGYQRKISTALLCVVTLIAIGTKFNAFFYQGVLMFLSLGWCLYKREKGAVTGILVSGVGALLIAVALFRHPYITNLIGWGNPLYPLMGEGAVDIMSYNTPEIYNSHNRFVNFFISMFYPDVVNFPFTTYGARFMGFSLFGGVLFIFSIILAILGRKKFPASAYFIMACAFIMCFPFEQSWWARYIPHFWLIPLVSFYCLVKYMPRKRLYAGCFLAMAAAGLLLSGAKTLYTNICYNRELAKERDMLKKEGVTIVIEEPFMCDLLLLDKWGIPYEITDSINPEESSDLFYFSEHSKLKLKR